MKKKKSVPQKLGAIDLIYSALLSSYLFRKQLKKYFPNLLNGQNSWDVLFFQTAISSSKEQAISLSKQFTVPAPTLPLISHLLWNTISMHLICYQNVFSCCRWTHDVSFTNLLYLSSKHQ